MEDAVIERRQGTGCLIGEGREVIIGSKGSASARRPETTAEGPPRLEHLSPKRGNLGEEVGKVAVGHDEYARVLQEMGVRGTDPVKDKVLVRVGGRLYEGPDRTHAQGACKEFDVEAPATALGVILR